MRKGPLVIYKDDSGIVKAMRNIPGVQLCHVERLNLLQVCSDSLIKRCSLVFLVMPVSPDFAMQHVSQQRTVMAA